MLHAQLLFHCESIVPLKLTCLPLCLRLRVRFCLNLVLRVNLFFHMERVVSLHSVSLLQRLRLFLQFGRLGLLRLYRLFSFLPIPMGLGRGLVHHALSKEAGHFHAP